MLAGFVGIAMMAVVAPMPTAEAPARSTDHQENVEKHAPTIPTALIISLVGGAILVRKILS